MHQLQYQVRKWVILPYACGFIQNSYNKVAFNHTHFNLYFTSVDFYFASSFWFNVG